jgi:hypothetical protein
MHKMLSCLHVLAACLTDEEARLDEEKIDELTKRQEHEKGRHSESSPV